MTPEPRPDMLTRARALLRIQRAARLVEYDLWRAWPIEDEKPGVIQDFMPWMAELATKLTGPDTLEYVTYELIDNVLGSCAPSLDFPMHVLISVLVLDRVEKNPAIARALTGA